MAGVALVNDNIHILHDLSKQYIYGILGFQVNRTEDINLKYNVLNHRYNPGLKSLKCKE